jgi:peptidoglycan/LPS O-acetylase OafA/YrhL
MQLGYVIFTALALERHIVALTCAVVVGAFVLAYLVWRFFERWAHRWIKVSLAKLADGLGWPSAQSAIPAEIQ